MLKNKKRYVTDDYAKFFGQEAESVLWSKRRETVPYIIIFVDLVAWKFRAGKGQIDTMVNISTWGFLTEKFCTY